MAITFQNHVSPHSSNWDRAIRLIENIVSRQTEIEKFLDIKCWPIIELYDDASKHTYLYSPSGACFYHQPDEYYLDFPIAYDTCRTIEPTVQISFKQYDEFNSHKSARQHHPLFQYLNNGDEVVLMLSFVHELKHFADYFKGKFYTHHNDGTRDVHYWGERYSAPKSNGTIKEYVNLPWEAAANNSAISFVKQIGMITENDQQQDQKDRSFRYRRNTGELRVATSLSAE